MSKKLFFLPNKKQKAKAFTMVETMIIIVILLILAIFVLVWTKPDRAQARDAKRISEINTMRDALRLYFLVKGKISYFNC